MQNLNTDPLTRTVLDDLEASSLQSISEQYFIFILLASILVGVLLWGDIRSKYFSSVGVLKSSPRYVSIAAVTVLGLTLLFTQLWGFSYAPFALVFALSSVMGIFSPIAALCLFISQAILRPWELIDLKAMDFIPKMTAALTFTSFFIHRILFARRTDLVTAAPIRFALAFAGWACLSSALFNEKGLAAFGGTLFVAIMLFLLCVNIPTEAKDIRRVGLTLMFSVAGFVAHSWVVSALRPITPRFEGRLEGIGLMGNSNDLASLVAMTLPIALIPWMRRRTWGGIFPVLIALATLVPGLILSQSRATVLAVLASGVIYWVGKNPKLIRKRALAACALIPLLAGISLSLDFSRSAGDLEGSTESRMNYIVAGLRMTASHPFVGVGFNNYPMQFDNYSTFFEFEWGQRTAHSTWIQVIAELGLPGFLLFILLFWTVFWRAWKVRFEYPELFVALTAYSICMSFLSHAYLLFPYMIAGLACASYRVHLKEAARR